MIRECSSKFDEKVRILTERSGPGGLVLER